MPGPLPPENIISNGGFENDLDGWTAVGQTPITESGHSGTKAFMASDLDSTIYSYVYQELGFSYDSTVISFWVNPQTDDYYQFFELISNWRPGPATFVTHVSLRDEGVTFSSLGMSSGIYDVLVPNAWNNITIKADPETVTQHFFVNDSLYASIELTEFPVVEHLLVGDLSITGNWGTLLYDDISITGTVNAPVPDRRRRRVCRQRLRTQILPADQQRRRAGRIER